MHYESLWWSIDLPAGAEASKTRSECLIQVPTFPGRLRLECLRKGEGTTTEDDLRRYAGPDSVACVIGDMPCYYGASFSRWVFASLKSDKMMMASHESEIHQSESRLAVEQILQKIKLK